LGSFFANIFLCRHTGKKAGALFLIFFGKIVNPFSAKKTCAFKPADFILIIMNE